MDEPEGFVWGRCSQASGEDQGGDGSGGGFRKWRRDSWLAMSSPCGFGAFGSKAALTASIVTAFAAASYHLALQPVGGRRRGKLPLGPS